MDGLPGTTRDRVGGRSGSGGRRDRDHDDGDTPDRPPLSDTQETESGVRRSCRF